MDLEKIIRALSSELSHKKREFFNQCNFNTLGIISARNYALQLENTFKEAFSDIGISEKNWCLVGIGGFGRGELSFASDLDLLFLYKRKLNRFLRSFIKNLVQSLWDWGFEVGHRVLVIDEVKRLVKEDFPFLTSILETVFLGGDEEFYKRWRKDFFKFFFSSEKKKKVFLASLISYRDTRFKKYGDSSYIIEPHIKEGKGGLRDVHIIRWLLGVVFGISDFSQAVERGLFLNIEREWLEEAENFLWRVRLQLHRINRRAFDRLTLQYQKELAGHFVFLTGDKSSTEEFMGHYFRQCARIRRLSEFLLEKAREVEKRRSGKGPEKTGVFLIYRDHISFSNPAVIPSNPVFLMEIFWFMAKKRLHFHHDTGQIIRKSLPLFSSRYIAKKEVVEKFFDILLNREFGFQTLYTMMETGFLDKFLPEFSHVRYRVQYDTYHTYTVDEHLLRSVYELYKMEKEEKYRKIFKKIRKYRKILFLATFLHDIGKGYNKDHAKYGSFLCKNISKRFGLNREEKELLCFLVEKHLLLIHTALKRDLSEEKPIETCVLEVGNKTNLYLLYLLTVADSRATGPGAWNLWRSSLLDDLLSKAERFLDLQKVDFREVQIRLKQKREEVLSTYRGNREELLSWLDGVSFRYLLNTSVDEILLHFELEKRLEREKLHLIPKRLNQEVAEVTIVCYDRPGLFDIITGIFWAYGLDILSANIHTRPYRVVVDKIVVRHIPDAASWERLWKKIKTDMLLILENKITLDDFLKRKQVRRVILPKASPIKKETKVEYDNKASDFYTIIEIYTWDRPGVLLKISRTLHEFGLNIFMAKISTLGSQVADIFYVTDKNGAKVFDQEKLKNLKRVIIDKLKEDQG